MKTLKLRYSISFFMFFATYALIIPYFQIFLYGKGYSASEIGLLTGFWEVAGIAGPFALGAVSKRTGSFRGVLLFASLISYLMLMLMVPAESFLLVLGATILFGFFYKPMMSVIDAMVSYSLPDPDNDYGHVRVMGSIGFAVVMIFFQITGIFSSPTPAMIAHGTLIIGSFFLLSLLILPRGERIVYEKDPAEGERRAGEKRKLPLFFLLLIIAATFSKIGFSGHYSFFSLFLQEKLHVEDVGIYWLIAVWAEIPVILFGGKILRRVGRYRSVIIAMAAMSIRMFIYTLTDSLMVIGAVQLLHGLAFGLFHASFISYVNIRLPREQKTLGMSLYISVVWGLGAFIGAPLCGVLIESSGYSFMFRIMSLIPVAGIVLMAGYELLAVRKGWERIAG